MISRPSILLAAMAAAATAFSFAPLQSTTKQGIQTALPMQLNDDEEYKTRRKFLAKVVATAAAPILFTSTQATAAVTNVSSYIKQRDMQFGSHTCVGL